MKRAATLGVLALALCGAKRQAPITWWEASLPSTMHPLFAASTLDLRAQAPVYDPLFEADGDSWKSVLATDFTVEAGTVRVTLRKDVKWHDGARFTGVDVCATVDALRSRDAITPLGSVLGPRLQHCATLPTDPFGVVLRLHRTDDPQPLAALAFPVLPAHLGPLTNPDGSLAKTPIGTGPWSARQTEFGVFYTPVSAPQHPGDRTTLRLFAVPDDAADRDRQVSAGLVDGWPRLPASEVASMRQRDGWTTHPYPLNTVIGVALDVTEPPLSDPGLRQHLDQAIDRKALCAKLVGSWPDARPAPCVPTMSPFLRVSDATNHGIPLPEPAALISDEPLELVVGIPAELDLDPQSLGELLATSWAPHKVQIAIVPLAELIRLTPTERRARYTAVVEARTPATDDLRPQLAIDGGRNWFAITDPAIAEVLGAQSGEELRTLHAVLADQRVWLPLAELGAMSAWKSSIRPLWMTPTDGLGAVERWGLSEVVPGPRPKKPAARPRR